MDRPHRVPGNRADACLVAAARIRSAGAERLRRPLDGRVDLENAVQPGDPEQLQDAVAVADHEEPPAAFDCRRAGGDERAEARSSPGIRPRTGRPPPTRPPAPLSNSRDGLLERGRRIHVDLATYLQHRDARRRSAATPKTPRERAPRLARAVGQGSSTAPTPSRSSCHTGRRGLAGCEREPINRARRASRDARLARPAGRRHRAGHRTVDPRP